MLLEPNRIVIDTCVLANACVADILLRFARLGAHKVFWSKRILDSTARTQRVRFRWEPRIVASYHARLVEVFPDSIVSNYERWIEQCTNDEGDRHVLACAIEAKAGYIITFNTDDFAEPDLAPWNVCALKPEDYLLGLYEADPKRFWLRLHKMARDKKVTEEQILRKLLRDCKPFASRLLSELDLQ